LLRSEKAGSGDRAALFDPVVDHLRRLAKEQGGLLLIMDDLQWLDEASLALLHYTSRLLLGWPALVACTARTAELPRSQARQAVSSLRRDGKLKEIGLGPLSVEAISLLAGSLNPELGREVAQSSGGNPLFAVELARSATALDESSTVGDLVANRLETLEPLPRELVSWGAVLGRSFSLETLAGVSGRPLIELLEAVGQLEEHSLWRPAGEVYDFAHDVVREAAYQSLSEPRRRLLHLQAARRLSRPAQVARHAELGGDGDLASEHYSQAAQEALKVLAFAEAAELARRGLDCCPDAGPARRLKLWETAILAGLPSGLLSVAEEALAALAEQAATRAVPEEEALASKVLSFLEFQRGRTDSLEAASWKTLEKGRGADRATAARMVAHSASCLACVQRDMARTEAVALEALELSREAGLNLADVNHALGIVGQFQDDLGGARTHLERAVDLSRQLDGEPWQTSLFLLHLGCVLLEQEDFAAVMPVAEEIRRLASPLKDSSERAFADLLLALAQGRDPKVELEALRAFDSKRILMFGHRYQAERHLRRGELDQAWHHALTAWENAEMMAVAAEQGLAASVLVRVSLLRGQRKAAAEWVRKVKKLDPSKVGVRAMSALRRAMHEGGYDGQSGSGGQLAGAGDRAADRR
jgi:hypothetical protein